MSGHWLIWFQTPTTSETLGRLISSDCVPEVLRDSLVLYMINILFGEQIEQKMNKQWKTRIKNMIENTLNIWGDTTKIGVNDNNSERKITVFGMHKSN